MLWIKYRSTVDLTWRTTGSGSVSATLSYWIYYLVTDIFWCSEFDNDLIVELYRNSETEAARVVCTVDYVGSWINDSRGGARYQSSMKASFLSVRRHGSTLLLTRRKNIWARLYFSDFESMFPVILPGSKTNIILRRYGLLLPHIPSLAFLRTGGSRHYFTRKVANRRSSIVWCVRSSLFIDLVMVY